MVVVESEGNGRMCLTLPETLITVWVSRRSSRPRRDLEVFLQLLPRSSTGERMNPYTSLWTGYARRRTAAFHLVLLDNGRTNTLADTVGRASTALHPLLRLPERLPGIRAHRRPRLRLGLPRPDRRGAHPALAGITGHADLAALRLLAVRCLLRRLPGEDQHSGSPGAPAGRVVEAKRRPRTVTPGPGREGRRRRPGHPALLAAAQKAAALAAGSGPQRHDRPLPGPLHGWSDTRDSPVPPAESFRTWWRTEP